jgi:hypothetical protein
MDITNLLQQMLILLIFMVVGYIAGKTKTIDATGNAKISKMLLNVAQPAMILSSALNSQVSFSPKDVVMLIVYAFAMYALLFILAYAVSPIFHVSDERKRVYRFMTVFANVAFMGYPVVSALYGPDAVLIASIYLAPFNVLVYSAGPIMLVGRGESKLNWRVLVNPAMVATVIALVITFVDVEFPYVICSAASSLGNMVVPGAMLVIGVSLSANSFKSVFSDGYTYLLCLVRLIIAPIVIWAVCGLFIKDSYYMGILVVLSSMPAAAIATMLCMEYGGDEETASRGIFMSTVLSVATTPLMIYLLLM